jgi:hydroxyethylthiazole kinase-like uncharacterized protein yjeF
MKLLTVEQIREWDKYTITRQKITSAELMERAAKACVQWILANLNKRKYYLFCGTGNNGGDGLAIARLLKAAGKQVRIIIAGDENDASADFKKNFQRISRDDLQSGAPVEWPTDAVIIDALFGSGLNRPVDGESKTIIDIINQSGLAVVSIDIPSGLFADKSSTSLTIVQADFTLTFQSIKLGFLIAENERFTGSIHVLDIGLAPEYLETLRQHQQLVDPLIIKKIFKPRQAFSHKGNFGHALLLAGSRGKMGAAVLAARACVRSGSGLVTCCVPAAGDLIMQMAVPEVMCIDDRSETLLTQFPDDIDKYEVVGVGPGIGKAAETAEMLKGLIAKVKSSLVIDADALNILSENQDLLAQLPRETILTPHPKEFERLFGKTASEFERIEMASQKAKELNVVIIVKGHHTLIASPDGEMYFNNTGNSGMAKGGSGDTLTGIITSLLGQKYSAKDAAILGVYLHGLAGDIAAGRYSEEAMLPSDLSDCLGEAFIQIKPGIQSF